VFKDLGAHTDWVLNGDCEERKIRRRDLVSGH